MRTLLIILLSLGLSGLLALITHGHVLFIGLPLMIGLPIAGLFGRRRPRRTSDSWRG